MYARLVVHDSGAHQSGIVERSTDWTDMHRHGSQVIFRVHGCHTLSAAHEAARYLDMLSADIEGPLEFVADLGELTAFDREARDVWQEVFSRLGPRIHRITLVNGSALARLTASAVGMYGGIPVRSCDTVEEALESLPQKPSSS